MAAPWFPFNAAGTGPAPGRWLPGRGLCSAASYMPRLTAFLTNCPEPGPEGGAHRQGKLATSWADPSQGEPHLLPPSPGPPLSHCAQSFSPNDLPGEVERGSGPDGGGRREEGWVSTVGVRDSLGGPRGLSLSLSSSPDRAAQFPHTAQAGAPGRFLPLPICVLVHFSHPGSAPLSLIWGPGAPGSSLPHGLTLNVR